MDWAGQTRQLLLPANIALHLSSCLREPCFTHVCRHTDLHPAGDGEDLCVTQFLGFGETEEGRRVAVTLAVEL